MVPPMQTDPPDSRMILIVFKDMLWDVDPWTG
jgi:hypothetical protein